MLGMSSAKRPRFRPLRLACERELIAPPILPLIFVELINIQSQSQKASDFLG
ncbi:hypothetical protein PARA125_001922 [Parachlamydia sp. AcF125]|nr:hypothetical protein [Parachlamydia sp. AcF125]